MDYIFERVYVETPVDTDGDGKLDLVAAWIRRPLEGKVPAVLVANPYLMTCNEDWYNLNDVNRELTVYPQQNIPEEAVHYNFRRPVEAEPVYLRETCGMAQTAIIDESEVGVEFECISPLYAYLNQKGYASVFCGGLGTLGSEGYTLTGSRQEVLAFKAVIDWLCGRARAFTNQTDNIEIRADWCTGKVAMSAKSYLGTMCIAVAATGVEGLETIIPEAGISNWYDYYREGGLAVPPLEWQGDDIDLLAKYCFSRAKDASDYAKVKDGYDQALAAMIKAKDRDSGNYNIFWDQRNYLNQIENFKASVFIIHGINDWNVKTNQCIPLFQALEKQGVERKMLLHQGEHVYVYDLEGSDTLSMVERWLDHYLRGADNGIEKEPKVLVESNVDQMQWMTSDTWPPEGWAYEQFPVSFREGSEGSEVMITDDLSATVYDKASDNQKEWRDELVLSEDPAYRNRLKLVWDPFAGAVCGTQAQETGLPAEAETLRVSGSVKVAFDAAIDRGTAILSAMLVDLGEDCRITAEQIPAASAKAAADDSTAAGDAPEGGQQPVLTELFRFGLEETPSKYKVISRGHLNAQNRTCLWSKEEIVQGQYYHYAFDMVPTDHTLKKGHKLGLILYGIDAEQTLRPDTVTKITVKPESIDVKVPLVR